MPHGIGIRAATGSRSPLASRSHAPREPQRLGLQPGPGDDLLRLQRTVGNQAVQQLLQRKIFINNVEKTRTSHHLSGLFGRGTLKGMLGDDKSRYFATKAEMYGYAKKETDTMGFVDTADTWVKLGTDLVVLGENHNAATTAASVIKAVGTSRYMHEMLTEPPAAAPKVTQAIEAREKTFKRKFGKRPTPASRSEAFFPKLKRGLADLTAVYQNNTQTIRWQGGKPWPPQYVMLRLAILQAADLPARSTSDLRRLYAANQAMFDTTAAQLGRMPDTGLHDYLQTTALSVAMAGAASTDLFDHFRDAAIAYTDLKIRAATAGQTGRRAQVAFEARWRPATTDYHPDQTSPIMLAEKERDRSMFEHIRQARAAGHLIFGMGLLHEERLADLLDHEGIRHTTVDAFLQAQQRLYPQ